MANKNKALDAVIKEAIENKIGNHVWNILKKHIESDIYGAYTPSGRWVWGNPSKRDSETNGYKRRKDKDGGLLNKSDVYIDVSHITGSPEYTLFVSTIAVPSPSVLGYSWVPPVGGFLSMLEKGDLGFWSRQMEKTGKVPSHPFPRPAIKNAQEEALSPANKSKYLKELKTEINKALK